MQFYLLLPVTFLKFWYFEAPVGLVKYFASVNGAFIQLFSLKLFIKTFFKPLKNEYRKGLVGFSIGAGIFVKTMLILVDLMLLTLLCVAELAFLLAFLIWPVVSLFSLYLNFLKIFFPYV